MSALNNAWNSMAGQSASNAYNSALQAPRPQGFSAMRNPPRKQDLPEDMLQQIMADPNTQRYWDSLTPDEQWRLIERAQKQQEEARMQAIADAYDPNKDEAYSVSLSTAVDLWRVKHGDAWVRSDQVYAVGDFYGEIEQRLNNNQCFESMTKHMRRWVRLKENL